LTLPAPTEGTFAFLLSIILWLVGFYNNICDSALSTFPSSFGCECEASLTSVFLGLIVTGAQVEVFDCGIQGDFDDQGSTAFCEVGFQGTANANSVFLQAFEGTGSGALSCRVFNNDQVDQFEVEVEGSIELDFPRTPNFVLTSCSGEICKFGSSAGPCLCKVTDNNGLRCPGDFDITFDCPTINLAKECVDLFAIL